MGDERDLLVSGNPLRFRALPVIFVAILLGVAMMAVPVSQRTMVFVATAVVGILALATLDLLGAFDDKAADAPTFARVAAPGVVTLVAIIAFMVFLNAGVAGAISPMAMALAMPTTVIVALIGAFELGQRLGPFARDESGRERPLLQRHGFWLLVLAALIQLPLLGSHSLTDPWETHYGEVSREVLARQDWISPWWAEDGWFWSKPILTFWLQALAMVFGGVRYEPGQMLSAVSEGAMPHPEWAVRMPCFLLMCVAVYLLYKGVAKTCGRRAGFVAGVALLTMPQFFFVAHQAMTDMPFVAAIAAALGLVLWASATDPDQRCVAYELPLGPFRPSVSLFTLVFGAVLIVALPQILYLLSRNLYIVNEPFFDVRFVADSFSQGSPGNCGTPGNADCIDELVPNGGVQPAVQALIWLQGLALLCWLSWGERRVQRLLYVAAWLFAGLAVMSKGLAGLGLPVLAALLWIAATRRWKELTRMEILAGLLVIAVTVLPWIVAMYVRHGHTFIDRLFFDHMVKRAFGEMHQTNASDDVSFRYYVWQLGYATFPWVGLAPVALVSWLRHDRRSERWSACALMAIFVLVGFALFSAMGTKFHHYCLPLLPGVAALLGVLVDDMLGERDSRWSAIAIGAAVVTLVVGADLAASPVRLLHLFTYKYTRPWPEHVDFARELWVFAFVGAVLVGALAWALRRRRSVVSLCAFACVFAVWTLDVYLIEVAPHWGQRELLVAYEHHKSERPGQMVAYQLNWKGENFYRGNAVPTFKTSGAKFQNWVDDHKKLGERTFYFITEHKRVPSLRMELGNPRSFEKLTDKRLNNKFLLLRASFP